jgi:hypothetical protein
VHSLHRSRALATIVIVVLTVGQMACGPEDYAGLIQQFQTASAVVIQSAEMFMGNANLVEQNAKIEQLAFERRPIAQREIDTIEIISPDEIKLRKEALASLSHYLESLAGLASGKAGETIASNTTNASNSLSKLAADAAKLAPSGSILNNANFAGSLSAAATAVGTVTRLYEEHKAAKEIEKAVNDAQKPVDDLISLISDEMTAAYARQRATLSAQRVYLYGAYNAEIKQTADPVVMLNLAERIQDYRRRLAALPDANPANAIDAMKAAHGALVKFVNSDRKPKSARELITAVETFYDKVQPLAEAVQKIA